MTPSFSGAFDLSKLKSTQPNAAASPNPGAQNGSVAGYLVPGDEATLRQYLQLSGQVVVLLLLHSAADPELSTLRAELTSTLTKLDGRVIGLEIDAAANPQLMQAVGATATPSVVAVIGGQPAPLFQGVPDAATLDVLMQQVLQLAAQNGVSGRVTVSAQAATANQPKLSPAHQLALDAFERGDLSAAEAGYQSILREFPNDLDARVGLAQTQFLTRIQNANPSATGAEAVLQQADLLYAAGELDACFNMLLDDFVTANADRRSVLRERLLQFFLIAGDDEPVVQAARRRLTSLLF